MKLHPTFREHMAYYDRCPHGHEEKSCEFLVRLVKQNLTVSMQEKIIVCITNANVTDGVPFWLRRRGMASTALFRHSQIMRDVKGNNGLEVGRTTGIVLYYFQRPLTQN